MNEVMVSVFCLAYNHEKYIKATLDGFVNQITDFKFEVLIHDDASTDNTAKIIREYAERYPEIIKPVFQTEILMQVNERKALFHTSFKANLYRFLNIFVFPV